MNKFFEYEDQIFNVSHVSHIGAVVSGGQTYAHFDVVGTGYVKKFSYPHIDFAKKKRQEFMEKLSETFTTTGYASFSEHLP